MAKVKRILIGSNGGLTGVYLAKQFRKMGKYIICGADSSETTVGKKFVDHQFFVPNSQQSGFIDSLIELLNSEGIDYYIPTHSKETKKIAEYSEELKKRTNTKFIVSPFETFCALESKEQAYYSLSAHAIPTPKIISDANAEFPIIMKGKIGSGSSSVVKIDNAEVYNAYKHTKNDVSFFEYISGNEYTTDCIFDYDGNLLGYNTRERVKTIGGAVVITRNSTEFDILPWLNEFERNWKFCGCVNFQFIVRDGIPYFMDINLRFPSGGLPITVESGINIPEMLLRIMDGEHISFGDYTVNPAVKTMYRYFEEYFDYAHN